MTREISLRTKKALYVTWISVLLNIALFAFKLFAGIIGRSSALVADAGHSLSDLATDIVILLGFQFVDKPADKNHNYGHGKVETLILIIIGVLLFAWGLKIIWDGVNKVISNTFGTTLPQPGGIAFFAALLSIFTKEWLYRWTVKLGKEIKSEAIVANAWHHRSDAFSSIGAAVGIGGAILLGPKWRILDPIAAIVLGLFIIQVAINSTRVSINELLEASLSEEMKSEILTIIRNIPGVKNPHDMKTRKIGNNMAIDIHIEVDKSLSILEAHDIATRVEEKIKKVFGKGTFVSVHIEPSG